MEFNDVYFTYPNTTIKVLNGISFKVSEVISWASWATPGWENDDSQTAHALLHARQWGCWSTAAPSRTSPCIRLQAIGFSQDPFLFYGSVKDNVIYNQEATDEQLVEALKMAGAWEFVRELENGVDTMVGDRGAMLSGGQRAGISLARALLKAPSLLILDEASSALDAKTETPNSGESALFRQGAGDDCGRSSSPVRFETPMRFSPWSTVPSWNVACTMTWWLLVASTPANGPSKRATWPVWHYGDGCFRTKPMLTSATMSSAVENQRHQRNGVKGEGQPGQEGFTSCVSAAQRSGQQDHADGCHASQCLPPSPDVVPRCRGRGRGVRAGRRWPNQRRMNQAAFC